MSRTASAVLIGFVPVVLMILTNQAGKNSNLMLMVAAATVAVSLLFCYILRRWSHPGIFMLLAVYMPAVFWVFLAASYPIFLPLFYAGVVLVLITSCLGAALAGKWGWFAVGGYGAFFAGMLMVATLTGLTMGQVWGEASLMTVGAFAIARICNIDVLGWLRVMPHAVHYVMEKVWY